MTAPPNSTSAVKLAGQQAAALLRDRHHLRPEEADDFNIRNPEDIIQAQLEASQSSRLSPDRIDLAGRWWIGIMNVMLVSVTERTREIGVRVAVGATEEAIQPQFLGESVLLSAIGGTIGIVLGIGVSVIGGRALGWAMQVRSRQWRWPRYSDRRRRVLWLLPSPQGFTPRPHSGVALMNSPHARRRVDIRTGHCSWYGSTILVLADCGRF